MTIYIELSTEAEGTSWFISFPDGQKTSAPTKRAVKAAIDAWKAEKGWSDRLDGRIAVEWEF